MTYLSAFTGPTPATGYVGYINISKRDDGVAITVRPESADGYSTVVLIIPDEAARTLFSESLATLDAIKEKNGE